MRSLRRTLLAAVLAIGAASCGDDDASEDTSAAGETTTTESVPDAEAEDPPDGDGDAGEDEGLGDPLVFVADLTGETEVPGPGDDAGSGRIEIESAVNGEWCIDMVAEALSAEVSGAHIHFGPEGLSGDVVIPIGDPTEVADGVDTWSDVCVEVDRDLVDEILSAPDAYYANVHTADFPAGAVRGQLVAATIFDLTLS